MTTDDSRQLSLLDDARDERDAPVRVWGSDSEAVRRRVSAELPVTDVVLASSVRGRRGVALLSWRPTTIDGVALLTLVRGGATDRVRLDLSEFHNVAPVELDRLLKAVRSSEHEAVREAIAAGGPLDDDLAATVRAGLRTVHAELADAWDEIEQLVRQPDADVWEVDDEREPIVAYEREATGIALDLAGLRRKRHLPRWNGSVARSFLLGFADVQVGEDALIAADVRRFGDWATAEDLVAAVTFEERGRRVTVVNANRTKIETTLGCDLVYYAHEYDSYVLVQYKRFRWERGRWGFRPSSDKGFDRQLSLLRRLVSGPAGAAPDAWRFGDTCCFVKFCEPVLRQPLTGELVRGMYLPLEYLDCVRAAKTAVGPRGGELLTYDSVGRWMSNGSFVDCVKQSWLGTRGLTSQQIAAVIQDALAANRSVVLAAAGGRATRSRDAPG